MNITPSSVRSNIDLSQASGSPVTLASSPLNESYMIAQQNGIKEVDQEPPVQPGSPYVNGKQPNEEFEQILRKMSHVRGCLVTFNAAVRQMRSYVMYSLN